MDCEGDAQRIQESQKKSKAMHCNGLRWRRKANTGNAEEEHSVARQKNWKALLTKRKEWKCASKVVIGIARRRKGIETSC